MAAAKKKNEDKSLAILRELITHNGNKYCFDCSQRGPTYVNMTIGSFVCSKCSGMLRGLTPPHRVKSISMATFSPEEIDQIKNHGNDYCRSIWLGLYEGNLPVLKDEQSLRDHLCEKYERKRYYLDPSFVKKQSKANEKPTVALSNKNNGGWYSSSPNLNNSGIVNKPAVKPLYNTLRNDNNNGISSIRLLDTTVASENNQTSTLHCPEFPVDFSTADIFNSSQVNNNTFQPFSSPASTYTDKRNSNPVSQDRYAALADLDLALRQQCQSQITVESKPNSGNPFDNPPASETSINSFYNSSLNGNVFSSNPFSVGYNIAQSGQSKNPFL